MPDTPAPELLKKGGKDEKPPRLAAPTLILSLTITEFYPLLNKKGLNAPLPWVLEPFA